MQLIGPIAVYLLFCNQVAKIYEEQLNKISELYVSKQQIVIYSITKLTHCVLVIELRQLYEDSGNHTLGCDLTKCEGPKDTVLQQGAFADARYQGTLGDSRFIIEVSHHSEGTAANYVKFG